MVKVNKLTLMVKFMMVIGFMVRNMVMDNKIGLAELFIKVNSRRVK